MQIMEALIQAIQQSAASNTFDPLAQHLAATTAEGLTPLMLACKACQPQAARLLMDSGASVWGVDDLGRSCLHFAAAGRGNHRCVRFVLARAAQEQQRDMRRSQGGPSCNTLEAFVNLQDTYGELALAALTSLTRCLARRCLPPAAVLSLRAARCPSHPRPRQASG